MSIEEYRVALFAAADRVLDESPSPSYSVSLASTTRLSAGRLSVDSPAAGQILQLCALLAPEPIPVSLFSDVSAELLPQPLRETARSSLALHRAIGQIVRYGLGHLSSDGLRLHRLTQAILRHSLSTDIKDEIRMQVEMLLVGSRPDDAQDPRQWPVWARLVPHILALDPANAANPALRDLACEMAWYLLYRGDTQFALTLAQRFHEHWLAERGPDDRDSLEAASILASAYRNLGTYREARRLDEEVYERRRRLCGRDHPDTIAVANNLAISLRALGEVQAARELDEDNLIYHQQNDGEDHPNTLRSAINLAADLRELRDMQAARKLDEDTLVMMRRVLGDNHLHTLRLANYLAEDLRALGDVQAAHELDEDTFARMRRVLGDDHPYTLHAASKLAEDLRRLGDVHAAKNLDQDTLARMRRVLGDDHPETLRVADALRRPTDTKTPWYRRSLSYKFRKRS